MTQCPKLRVHPAPGVHISTAGRTILGGVHPVSARFLSDLLLLYIGRVHGAISGCTVLWEVHPASAQNKSLISDTACKLVVTDLSNSSGGGGGSLKWAQGQFRVRKQGEFERDGSDSVNPAGLLSLRWAGSQSGGFRRGFKKETLI